MTNNNVSSMGMDGKQRYHFNIVIAILLAGWTLVGFGIAQLLLVGLIYLLSYAGVSIVSINSSVLNTSVAVTTYLLSMLIIVGLPMLVKKYRTSWGDLGLARLITWKDMGIAPIGFIVYFFFSALLVYVAKILFKDFNLNQLQETGFNTLSHYYEYLLAFITLIVVAPLAEEILFRGFLYGKLKKYVPVWLAMILTSLAFGAIHGQWNIAVDVFALSIILCCLRELSGSIWAGILLHMLKNGLAFYILFINPLISHTMGT